MQELCGHIYDDYLAEKIWPGTRALADLHRRRGEPVWLVTAAPIELAEVSPAGSASTARWAPGPRRWTASSPAG
jgi:hypothetical protein